jgi:phospholipid/cholesterol/gamma-HCH transport system ATP-binding protein
MKKRAGLARALAADPELVFLDEPTAGLDPISANQFDELVKNLQRSLNLTVFMVTHDLDTLLSIVDRVIALASGRVIGDGPVAALAASEHPWLKSYFSARAPHLQGST